MLKLEDLQAQLKPAMQELHLAQSACHSTKEKLSPTWERLEILQQFSHTTETVNIDGVNLTSPQRKIEISKLNAEYRGQMKGAEDGEARLANAEGNIQHIQSQIRRVQTLMQRTGINETSLSLIPGKAGGLYTGGQDSTSEDLPVPQQVQALMEAWSRTNSIDLIKRALTEAERLALIQGLADGRSTITTLRMMKNKLDATTLAGIFSALGNNQRLLQFSCRLNGISDALVAKLVQPLSVNFTLTALSLNDNSISNLGCKSIADILRKNRTIEDLSLRNNAIGDAGAAVLADALKVNKVVQKLAIYDNPLGNGKALAAQVAKYSACKLLIAPPAF
jgi:hypothetical protein